MTTPIEQDDEAARLRADIARTRARLVESVDALTARLDVPGRVHDAASRRVEPVRRLADAAATKAAKATGAATRAANAAGKARTTAAKATGVAWGLARDGVGIGVALARWGAGSVVDALRAAGDQSRDRPPVPPRKPRASHDGSPGTRRRQHVHAPQMTKAATEANRAAHEGSPGTG
ncbi:DUF3618 domain-containing protein [Dactylosporangium cerinum]|uniref:DUF3618 domain-containing protein n=1 Tax=Dactylosporangium cerinum TaxID=1434730 RepID=A0ABV9W2G8_9ACTN